MPCLCTCKLRGRKAANAQQTRPRTAPFSKNTLVETSLYNFVSSNICTKYDKENVTPQQKLYSTAVNSTIIILPFLHLNRPNHTTYTLILVAIKYLSLHLASSNSKRQTGLLQRLKTPRNVMRIVAWSLKPSRSGSETTE